MTGKTKRSSVVANTVSVLRRSILAQEDGSYVGSEEQLMLRFGISRPTLRQAVRLLEHERLLVIKQGSGGGYYARRPQIEAVAHAAAIYLSIERATPSDIFAASVPLVTEAIRLAAKCRDEALRARLADLLTRSEELAKQGGLEFKEVLAADLEFSRIITEMCGNQALKLFISITYEFGKTQWKDWLLAQDSRNLEQWRAARDKAGRAVLNGDAELAALYSQRRSALVMKLIDALTADVGSISVDPYYGGSKAKP